MVEAVAAVAAVTAGNLIIVRGLYGEIWGGPLLMFSLQDPTNHIASPSGGTCTGRDYTFRYIQVDTLQ